MEGSNPAGHLHARRDQTRFDDLAILLLDEYRANARRSLDRAEDAVRHLEGFFTGWRAQAISTDRILAYIRHRQQQQAANATINRELAALKRMFRLGERAGKVLRRPFIDMLQEHNARTGFFERADFDAVLARLPADLEAVFAVAYKYTGWRVKSEILTRQTESIYRRYAIVDEAMLKEGAVKLQTLHEVQGAAAPVIPLTRATRKKRVSSSTVRVSPAQRERRSRAAPAKSLQAGKKGMVGWDGIEPPTPGFSDLGPRLCKYA